MDATEEDPQVGAILDDETLEAAPEQVAAVLVPEVKAAGRNGGGKGGAVGNEGSRNLDAEAAAGRSRQSELLPTL